MDIVTRKIDDDYWADTKEAYEAWERLNSALKKIKSRKANFPSGVSEAVVGRVYGYDIITQGSGDLYAPRNDRIVEVKATSNYNIDLSSFSPSEFYDNLVFVRYNQKSKVFEIYDLNRNRDAVDPIQISKKETYRDQREQGRRSRFSVLDKIIKAEGLEPDRVFCIRDGVVKVEVQE